MLCAVLLVAMRLVQFYGPNNQIIEVNPDAVASIRAPRQSEREHFHSNVNCLLFTSDGKFIGVMEDCKTVEQRLLER